MHTVLFPDEKPQRPGPGGPWTMRNVPPQRRYRWLIYLSRKGVAMRAPAGFALRPRERCDAYYADRWFRFRVAQPAGAYWCTVLAVAMPRTMLDSTRRAPRSGHWVVGRRIATSSLRPVRCGGKPQAVARRVPGHGGCLVEHSRRARHAGKRDKKKRPGSPESLDGQVSCRPVRRDPIDGRVLSSDLVRQDFLQQQGDKFDTSFSYKTHFFQRNSTASARIRPDLNFPLHFFPATPTTVAPRRWQRQERGSTCTLHE